MHEFEALLFSDSEILADELNIDEELITNVIDDCGEPEAINNKPETAPNMVLSDGATLIQPTNHRFNPLPLFSRP